MQIITKAVLVHSLTDIEIFSIRVNELRYPIIRKRLELEHEKIVRLLKILKEQGEIKSIFKPRNKRLQPALNRLIEAKKIIKESIKDISEVYYK